jgi:hypothetical protein
VADFRKQLTCIREDAASFFAHADESLPPEDREGGEEILKRLGQVVTSISIIFEQAPVLGVGALRTLRDKVRQMEAALRFMQWQGWEEHSQYSEDYQIGVTPAGEYENSVQASIAQSIFENAIDHILRLLCFAASPDPNATSTDQEQARPMDIPETSAFVAADELETPTTTSAKDSDPVVAERRALLIDFKTKARGQGIRVTDKMVAKEANSGKWNDRTMVTKWKAHSARCHTAHDKKISAFLRKDPSLIWSKAGEPITPIKQPPK